MALRFTVLASGSGGNASLIQSDDFGLLLDFGLGPRQLAASLAQAGFSWQDVDAVLLTHTHSAHWNDITLAHLRRRRIPLYCHSHHHPALLQYGQEFAGLLADDLVRTYQGGSDLELPGRLRCRPVALQHDGGPTYGFRLEQSDGLFGATAALAYAADLGCWTPEVAQALADVDVLALEFNHDVDLEYASGRSPRLIQRVLSDQGHLSNLQAAGLLQEILRRTEPSRLRHVVQLHLSRDCNRPELAQAAAQAVLPDATTVAIHTASQHEPCRTLNVGAGTPRRRAPKRKPISRTGPVVAQPWLPGCEP